jgi:hypothetical protein
MNEKDKMKLISCFEQAGAVMGEFARLLGQYYNELCQAGFARDEALKLTIAYQEIILKQSLFVSNEDDELHLG